jgi:hypothetical protein
MNGENLVTDEPVEFEESLVEVQGFKGKREISHSRGI